MTLTELHKCLAYWQERLRLQDWQVSIKVVRAMEISGNWGEVEKWPLRKQALIQLTAEADRLKTHPFYEPIEQTLVHELLHLHTAPFDLPEDDPREEHMIHALASALVGEAE